jgi:glycosyltransferase involved in cell wall biosynthesis
MGPGGGDVRILFIDDSFPGHFRHLPGVLAADPAHEVVFGTKGNAPLTIGERAQPFPGVTQVRFREVRQPRDTTHPFLRRYEAAVLNGQSVYRMCRELLDGGFEPDVVYAFAGWGPPLFVRDAFPDARLVVYADWYYWTQGSVYDFFPGRAATGARAMRIHLSNAATLRDVVAADRVIVTTEWQRRQFPRALQPKIVVCHDGIDTDTFSPAPPGRPPAGFVHGEVDLRGVDELVTYVTRGMEPYRGFEPFMGAVAELQRRRPHAHVVVAGTDGVYYSWRPPGGGSWKDHLLARLPLDLDRLHFVGPLPTAALVDLLRASAAHVHLSAPFLPSWSLFEAMAAGCVVVGSANPPVDALVRHGANGLLADFFQPVSIADQLDYALEHRAHLGPLRAAARATIVDGYRLDDVLARQRQLLEELVGAPVASGRP